MGAAAAAVSGAMRCEALSGLTYEATVETATGREAESFISGGYCHQDPFMAFPTPGFDICALAAEAA